MKTRILNKIRQIRYAPIIKILRDFQNIRCPYDNGEMKPFGTKKEQCSICQKQFYPQVSAHYLNAIDDIVEGFK